ncbi:MAG: zinc carboxypeptidase [Saprospiraceae bacterium]|nr:zinc carboxypeptidase [Saprospiraceae bacterium]
MKRTLDYLLLGILLVLSTSLSSKMTAQSQAYYFGDTQFDPAITSPSEYLGWEIGTWHITHDQLVGYLKVLAAESDKIDLIEIGKTHEGRSLLNLHISAPKNLSNLESIRKKHLQNLDPNAGKIEKVPSVVYQGFSIHGNEASGGNAAALHAYYLAAAKDPFVEAVLEKTIILMDPCFNPDGFQRFASWVNSRKSLNLVSDVQSEEFHEPWPGGRTNHYWFDLNRDWLPAFQPESQARLKVFYDWRPQVFTDHHEMGSDKTFFFQPGVPSRTNPLTPLKNQELTGAIGRFHAKALDKIGSLYYSREGYDDFYYGKGSTFPDAVGSIGILFEQASARGHLRDTEFGQLSFAFAIRNQVTAAKSTLEAVLELGDDLKKYQQDFTRGAIKKAGKDPRKAFVVSAGNDTYRLQKFVEMLGRHQVACFLPETDLDRKDKTFKREESVIIPLDQSQYTLIRACFDTLTSFTDSIFYDISAWTMPYAYNLHWTALPDFSNKMLGEEVSAESFDSSSPAFNESEMGYLISWEDYQAPAAVYAMQNRGLKVRVCENGFQYEGMAFGPGTILIHGPSQNLPTKEVFNILKEVASKFFIHIKPVTTFENLSAFDLGSPQIVSLDMPRPLLVTGEGASAYETGETWHFLDQRMHIPTSMIDGRDLGSRDLSRYNVIILADGSFGNMGTGGTQKIKDWLRDGGTLIAMGNAVRWAEANKLVKLTIKPASKDDKGEAIYKNYSNNKARNRINGAIFHTKMDMSHPLSWGLPSGEMAVFRKESFFLEPTEKPYASPMLYTKSPLLAGYISKENVPLIANSAAITVHGMGRGTIICTPDSWNFRGFWFGTNRLFVNSLFFGPVINNGTKQ